MWRDGKWEQLPTDMARFVALKLAAMERVRQGTSCEMMSGCCKCQAVGVVADTMSTEPFYIACGNYNLRLHSRIQRIFCPPAVLQDDFEQPLRCARPIRDDEYRPCTRSPCGPT